MLLFCLFILPLAQSFSLNGCDVQEGSRWSECSRGTNCPAPPPESWFGRDPGLGESRRALNMAQMKLDRRSISACRQADTCPQFKSPDSIWDVQECVDGFAGEWPCDKVDLLAFINIDDLGYDTLILPDLVDDDRNLNDIWGWTDPNDQEDYVFVGISGGTSFVRITDPENPVVLAFLPTHTNASFWRDIKVFDHHAFIGSEAQDHGIQIFDLHQLRGWDDYQGWLTPDTYTHYAGIGHSHNVAINTDTHTLYVMGSRYGDYDHCLGGLHMVDIEDPLNPQFLGCFAEDGYVHDSHCVIYEGPDTRYSGHEICFCFNEDAFTIVDVNNKNNPQMLSTAGYDGYGYTHQGWLTDSHEVILMDDELDEHYSEPGDQHTRTYIWNVKDLDNPVLENIHYSWEESYDHNQYIVKNLTYQSNRWGGLRILEIKEEDYELEEKAYFKVWRDDDVPGYVFYGTWSNYPFTIKNGQAHPEVVAVTSMEFGLFLLRPRYDLFQNDVTSSQERHHATDNCENQVETRQCEPSREC